MRLRILDLFSGIGGFSLGLERTGGFETAGFCEIDPFCRRVLAAHWPDVPCHDDVRTMQFTEGMADVVTAGFPCQDVSYAGAGAGLAGERSGLYREVVRAVRMVRPLHAILENVAALLGRGLGTVLGDMAEIGYDAEWHCIPASAVGAPHRRDRIWIMAHAHGAGLEGRWGNVKCSGERSSWAGVSAEDWSKPHPDLYREPDGVSGRMDRLKALGNAVVPQIPEIIGRAILATRGKC